MTNDEQILDELFDWYNKYTSKYKKDGNELQGRAVSLKVEHTYRVIDNSRDICKAIEGSEELRFLSDIVSLFHDIGRFEQFRLYKTFADRFSVNHAELGVEIINKYDLLSKINNKYADCITNAILYHNVRKLPADICGLQYELCRLIRDSDKIDIYKIAAEQYINPDPFNGNIIGIGTKDDETVSDEVCDAVFNGESVDYSLMKSLTDFKLVQLGWAYDLNYRQSFKIVKEMKYFDVIKNCLPDQPKINRVVEKIEQHIDKILKNNNFI